MGKAKLFLAVCVGVVVAAVVAGHLLRDEVSPERVTLRHLEFLCMATEGYYKRNGRVPPVAELVASLPTFMLKERAVVDGWGRAVTILRADGAFVFLSKGPDGILNTNDDIVRVQEVGAERHPGL